MKTLKPDELKCEFCGDVPHEIFLHAKCHLTAPLQVSIVDGWILIRCYLPECLRLVAKFKLAEEVPA